MGIEEHIWLGQEAVANERESGDDWPLTRANTVAVQEFLSCRDGGVIDSSALHPDAVGACELDAFIGLSMRGGLLGYISVREDRPSAARNSRAPEVQPRL